MNELIECKWMLLIAFEFAVSFFVFGFISGKNHKEDEMLGRERFWVLKHFFGKKSKGKL